MVGREVVLGAENGDPDARFVEGLAQALLVARVGIVVLTLAVERVVGVVSGEPPREEVPEGGRAAKAENAAVELGKRVRDSRQGAVVALEKLVSREIEALEQVEHVGYVAYDAGVGVQVEKPLERAEAHEYLVAEAEGGILDDDKLVPKGGAARQVGDKADGDPGICPPKRRGGHPGLLDIAPARGHVDHAGDGLAFPGPERGERVYCCFFQGVGQRDCRTVTPLLCSVANVRTLKRLATSWTERRTPLALTESCNTRTPPGESRGA